MILWKLYLLRLLGETECIKEKTRHVSATKIVNSATYSYSNLFNILVKFEIIDETTAIDFEFADYYLE